MNLLQLRIDMHARLRQYVCTHRRIYTSTKIYKLFFQVRALTRAYVNTFKPVKATKMYSNVKAVACVCLIYSVFYMHVLNTAGRRRTQTGATPRLFLYVRILEIVSFTSVAVRFIHFTVFKYTALSNENV